MERVSMRLEVLRAETLGALNNHFRRKVQLKEELDENEVQIHFKRGIMEGLFQAKGVIEEIQKGDKLEDAVQERLQRRGGDHEGKLKEAPIQEVKA